MRSTSGTVRQTTAVTITTQGMPDRSVASTNGSQIVVDNRAVLPDRRLGPVLRRFQQQHQRRDQPLHGRRLQHGRDLAPNAPRRSRVLDRECRERRNRRRTRLARLVLPGRVGRVPAEHRHAQGSREEHRPTAGRPHQLPDADEPLLQPRDAAPAGQGHVPDAHVDPGRRRLRPLPAAGLVPAGVR